LKKVDVDPLVCITRCMLERGIHKINMGYAV
jgi:hypothetical protein